MLKLYRLSESQADAAALVGVDDIERRQHVHQLTHRVLAGCKQGSQPFTWIRAAGLRTIAAALSVGLEDGQALTAVLEATYSQVLEVILSTLDRDLIPAQPAESMLAAAAACQQRSSSSSSQQVSALLSAVGRYPAGYAPAAASTEELQEAFRVLQALCLLHHKARGLLCRAQYLQLVTARACEAPACLTSAMNTLLCLLQGNEEAQGLFVTTGGMDMLLTRTLQHMRHQPTSPSAAAAAGQEMAAGSSLSSSDALLVDGGGLTRKELAVQLLLFLQFLVHWVVAAAVEAGAHPGTQRAALALIVNHLGPDAAAAITEELPAQQDSGGQAPGTTQAGRPGLAAAASAASVTWMSQETVLQQRAAAAAVKLLCSLH